MFVIHYAFNWKMSKFWCRLAFRLNRICYIMFMFVRVLSIGLCQETIYRSFIHRYPAWTDGSRCFPIKSFKSILLAFYLLLASVSPVPLKFFVFDYGTMNCEAKTSARMSSTVVWIQLIRWVYSLSSGFTAFQSAFVMIRVSGWNLPFSVSV